MIEELRQATPEREYICGPMLGLTLTEIVVRYFQTDSNGVRPEEPYWAETVDLSTDAGLDWLRNQIQLSRARTGKLFTA